MDIGPQLGDLDQGPILAPLALHTNPDGTPSLGCDPVERGESTLASALRASQLSASGTYIDSSGMGKVVLVMRGTCTFTTKVPPQPNSSSVA